MTHNRGQCATEQAIAYGRGNFAEAGKLYLVRCPECKRENYVPAVATGQCAWCGWGKP